MSSSTSSKEERVRVAVRVRPFREEARGCSRIVDMEGPLTCLTNPQDPSDRKTFTFDHSFWSFDGFKLDEEGRAVPDPEHPRGDRYCGQERLFDVMGKSMLADAFHGYNTTLFSYGQTGAGKSYSIMGYGPNEGIVPQFCHHIFDAIDERLKSDSSVQFEVHLSMLEIYNEAVYDLLNSPSKNGRGLKVREHPKKGFYAEGLKSFLVTNYSEIERFIGQGTLNRTVTSTNMNATSSRAHMIVTLSLVQKKITNGNEMITTSIVNIVDLAGSERVAKAGNTSGERFREGVSINQSLQCLGHCIHALAESATSSAGSNGPSTGNNNSSKVQRIPYRDSVLTKLLMNALGGNSKTVMIASISPADNNYEETLSTLRYADRAKQIRTRATVNEDPTEKLVRDLKVENQRLKALLSKGDIDPQWLKSRNMNGKSTNPQAVKDAKKKWEEELKSQLAQIDREIQDFRTPKQEKILQTQASIDAQPDLTVTDQENTLGPYLQNVNMDPLLNGRWKHFLTQGTTTIGKAPSGTPSIEMIGPGMQENHAEIRVEGKRIFIRPLTEDGRVLINGIPASISDIHDLKPNDRLVFGSTQLWLFRHPTEEENAGVSDSPMINYDFFLNEMAAKSGLDVLSSPSESKASLQEELLSLLPCVEEANGISAELDKWVQFQIVLVAPQISGPWNPSDKTVHSQAYIKMKNLDNGMEYLWSRDKFLNRFDLMKELYRRFQLQMYGEGDPEDYGDENGSLRISNENDPFAESPDAVVVIGVARIFLQPLAYLVEIRDEIAVTDLRGTPITNMEVAVLPCADAEGRQLDEVDLIEAPEQLVGRNVYLDFRLNGCRSLPSKFKDVHCKYRFYGDKTDNVTESMPYSDRINFEYRRILRFEPATKEFVDYLNHGSVVIEVLGRHVIPSSGFSSAFKKSLSVSGRAVTNGLTSNGLASSRQAPRLDRRDFSRTGEFTAELQASNHLGVMPINGQKQELLAELQYLKESHVRLQQRLAFIRQLVDSYITIGKESFPTALLDAALNVNSSDQAKRIVQQLSFEAGRDLDGDWDMSGRYDSSREQRRSGKEERSSICTIS